MPVGVICNVLALAAGGLIGAKGKNLISGELKEKLYLVFGTCAMGIGISSVILMKNMPAVILSVVLGSVIGVLLHLNSRIEKGGAKLAALIPSSPQQTDQNLLVTAIVLFCVSGTGIYGCIYSGISGDHSILIAKSVLDLFTAMIFACALGTATALIAIPQAVFFLLLFFGAKLLYPLTTSDMICDFRACGGLIMLATGLRIAKVKDFPIADMIPAMLLVWPVSWMWSAWILPLL